MDFFPRFTGLFVYLLANQNQVFFRIKHRQPGLTASLINSFVIFRSIATLTLNHSPYI